jgi:dienelactone hydrolase
LIEKRARTWARWIQRGYMLALLLGALVSLHGLEQSRAELRTETSGASLDGGPSVFSLLPPGGEAAPPAVLLVHGQPGSKEHMLELALALSRSGIGAHLIDLPGCGRARGPDTPEARKEAVRAAFRSLAADRNRTNGRVLLLGQGVGADAAVAAADELQPPAIIALAPLLASASLDDEIELVLLLGERQPREVRERSQKVARELSPRAATLLVPSVGTLALPLAPETARRVVAVSARILGKGTPQTGSGIRLVWLASYVACCFLLFPPLMSTLAWLKGEAPDVFLSATVRPGFQLGVAALAAAAAPLALTVGIPLGFLQLAGGDAIASVALASAVLRGLLLWASRFHLHMPPLRSFVSSSVLGLFPFAYLYLLLGGVLSSELLNLRLDGPRTLVALSLVVFLLPYFLLEEAASGAVVRKLGAPIGFLFGGLTKLFLVWAVLASGLLEPSVHRLLVASSLPLLTVVLLLLQMFTTFVLKSTENATMAASFGALTFSWLLAALFPLV